MKDSIIDDLISRLACWMITIISFTFETIATPPGLGKQKCFKLFPELKILSSYLALFLTYYDYTPPPPIF